LIEVIDCTLLIASTRDEMGCIKVDGICEFNSVLNFLNMKATIIFLTLLIGACWAADNLVPWTSTTEVIPNIPYKIDAEANFSNGTLKSISINLKRPAKGLNIKYKKAENESIYLLITSLKKCVQDRMNDVNHPSRVIVVCLETHSKKELYTATRIAMEMNRMIFHPDEKADEANEVNEGKSSED
jgi:hypothetical protein